MNEKAKEARRAYNRAYYHAHKEARRQTNERYWNRKAEKIAAEQEGKDGPKNADD